MLFGTNSASGAVFTSDVRFETAWFGLHWFVILWIRLGINTKTISKSKMILQRQWNSNYRNERSWNSLA